MLTRIAVCTLVLAGITAAAARPLLFQEEMPQMPQPGAEHEELLQGVGTWEGTLTMTMPGMPGDGIPAREVVTPVGGFWTQSRFECDFMGAPYVGTGCMGYDTQKKKYVGTWCDSMSSFLALMEGEKDEESGAIVMRWTAPDMTGAMTSHRSETEFSEDSYTSTFYVGEGEGTKTMVISMTRKSKKPVEAKADK